MNTNATLMLVAKRATELLAAIDQAGLTDGLVKTAIPWVRS
jgi:hypothetical protein